MGNSESKERQLFIRVILQSLSKRGIKIKKSNIQSFFHLYQTSDTAHKVSVSLFGYKTYSPGDLGEAHGTEHVVSRPVRSIRPSRLAKI